MNIQNKSEIRNRIHIIRKEMDIENVRELSGKIAGQLFSLDFYNRAPVLYTYLSFDNEADTSVINTLALESGKRIAVPRVEKDGINFYYINSYEDIKPGTYGISEPDEYCERAYPPEGGTLTILVPGIAFDKKLNRIGFGKGYYDNFFKNTKCKFIKIALAYGYQVIENIPSGQNDVKMDYLITEKFISRRIL